MHKGNYTRLFFFSLMLTWWLTERWWSSAVLAPFFVRDKCFEILVLEEFE